MKITFAKSFQKQFKKLSKQKKERFKERLIIFQNNIFDTILNNHKLTGPWLGHRSINITGDYRAIFRNDADITTFVTIGTHSQLYK